jgi:hypothetical protein
MLDGEKGVIFDPISSAEHECSVKKHATYRTHATLRVRFRYLPTIRLRSGSLPRSSPGHAQILDWTWASQAALRRTAPAQGFSQLTSWTREEMPSFA